ncbi:helix-turn-helix domain-containing protein [Paenibacillus amylolyticus]|uniref:helix-turn-helix domain-containing protein n=1 Tax=Paenibacillus amylolyticus TaxID=1451 RepID=UPI00201DC9AF|nr:helix-turn-helix transcriptional regulator [Paenibacillus amylolyticus]MCL6663506.1 helix-turn-helix transcriptional regulator [Paenibacillus amylolyticus]
MAVSLIQFLQNYRKEHGLTLRGLETKIRSRYTYSHLAKVEQGRVTITRDFLKVLSEELDVSLYYLLTCYYSMSDVVNLDFFDEDPTYNYNRSYDEIKELLKNYHIISTNNYQKFKENQEKFISDEGNLNRFLDEMSVETNIDSNRLKQIIIHRQPTSLDEAELITFKLNQPFYELFSIQGLSYYDKNDVNVAMTIHKYIERNRNKKLHHLTTKNELLAVTAEEEVYLLECLKLYRQLGLKSYNSL